MNGIIPRQQVATEAKANLTPKMALTMTVNKLKRKKLVLNQRRFKYEQNDLQVVAIVIGLAFALPPTLVAGNGICR